MNDPLGYVPVMNNDFGYAFSCMLFRYSENVLMRGLFKSSGFITLHDSGVIQFFYYCFTNPLILSI